MSSTSATAGHTTTNVASKLAVKPGMEAFEPAIVIFNKLCDLRSEVPFLRNALRGVTKLVRVVEGLQGNREVYATYIEKALKMYERLIEGAQLANCVIRPGTVTAIVLEVIVKDITATREEIEDCCQLRPVQKLRRREEIRSSVESRTTWLDRPLARLTVQKLSGLMSGSDLAWSPNTSPDPELPMPTSATAVTHGSVAFAGPEEARSIQELFENSIRQGLSQIQAEIQARSALKAGELHRTRPMAPGSVGLARRLMTHQQGQFRKHREKLRDLFQQDGTSEDAEPSSPAEDQGHVDSAQSAVQLIAQLCTYSVIDQSDTATGALQRLADDLEELDLLKREVTVLQIVATLSRGRLIGNGSLQNRIDHAWALLHLGSLLNSVSRREEASAASEEAMSTIEAAAELKPDKYQHLLAMSLKMAAICKNETGDIDGAMERADRALAQYRSLHKARPQEFEADLADMLLDFSMILNKGAKQEDALDAMEESLCLYRSIRTTRPQECDENFAVALCNYSLLLYEVGQTDEALEAIQESISLQQILHEARPAEYKAGLAWTLSRYCIQLSNAGEHTSALEAAQECLEMRRIMHQELPKNFKSELAWTLGYYSVQLRNAGRYNDAIAAIEECLTLRRSLYAMRPETFNDELAWTLANYSTHLNKAGRHREALAKIEECVKIRRQLYLEQPARYKADLAWALNAYSYQLSKAGRSEDALKAIEESIGMYESLHEERPAAYESALSKAQKQRLMLLQRVRQDDGSGWRRREPFE
ncbi:hypothetical protein CF327_g5011 [Tilletia walkeri]|nr:hypothetical protein CF327_g5011 [Tilletia walkeri]